MDFFLIRFGIFVGHSQVLVPELDKIFLLLAPSHKLVAKCLLAKDAKGCNPARERCQ